MSSQRKFQDCIRKIEEAIQEIKSEEEKCAFLNEYKEVLENELEMQQENEVVMLKNLKQLETLKDSSLEARCSELDVKISECEKYVEYLKDEIENATIQFIVDKETLRMEQDEEEKRIVSFYESERHKLNDQLNNIRREHERKVWEINEEIDLELSNRNAKLEKMSSNLHRQIAEKRNMVIKLQNDHQTLVKELNTLKSQQQANINNKRSKTELNIIEFRNDYLVQQASSSKNYVPAYPTVDSSNLTSRDSEINIHNFESNQVASKAEKSIRQSHTENERKSFSTAENFYPNKTFTPNENYNETNSKMVEASSNNQCNTVVTDNADLNLSKDTEEEQFDCYNESNVFDIPRKGPTVYKGATRKGYRRLQ